MDKESDRLSLHPLSFEEALKALAPRTPNKSDERKKGKAVKRTGKQNKKRKGE